MVGHVVPGELEEEKPGPGDENDDAKQEDRCDPGRNDPLPPAPAHPHRRAQLNRAHRFLLRIGSTNAHDTRRSEHTDLRPLTKLARSDTVPAFVAVVAGGGKLT